jgi:hypothetical protein
MTRWIDWLRKLDWLQWLALVALLSAYAVIAMPFLGVSWKRMEDFGPWVILLAAVLLISDGGKRVAVRQGVSGLGHLGVVAMIMMFLWGQPWWSVSRPQQADDFWLFIWPFVLLVNATRILLAGAPDRDGTAREKEPGLA